MIINSSNEWGKLKSIVVGSATHANWPSNDPVFALESAADMKIYLDKMADLAQVQTRFFAP